LSVRGMVKNHCLARAISDVGMGMFRQMLEYKAGWYGKEIRLCDRFFPSSKRCHDCGHIVENLPLNIRDWDCPKCDCHHDRDHNAAINILAGGRPVKARGELVSRPKTKVFGRKVRRTVNQLALCDA
jgi:putative transposase